MSTINSVQQAVDSLREAFDAHVIEDKEVYKNTKAIQKMLEDRTVTIANIQDHVKNIDERLIKQETESKKADLSEEDRKTLQDIRKIARGIKWGITAVAVAFIGFIVTNLGNYIWHLIHP